MPYKLSYHYCPRDDRGNGGGRPEGNGMDGTGNGWPEGECKGGEKMGREWLLTFYSVRPKNNYACGRP